MAGGGMRGEGKAAVVDLGTAGYSKEYLATLQTGLAWLAGFMVLCGESLTVKDVIGRVGEVFPEVCKRLGRRRRNSTWWLVAWLRWWCARRHGKSRVSGVSMAVREETLVP